MRILLALTLAGAALAQEPFRPLAGVRVTGFAVVKDALWVATDRGTLRVSRHGIQPIEERVVAPVTEARHAGWHWTVAGGRLRRDRLRPRFVRYLPPRSKRIHALAEGPGGAIWCGTDKGVVRYKDGGFVTMQADLGVVTAVEVDRDGVVWIGSGSGFLGTMRYAGGSWDEVAGIDAYVHSIGLDDAGTLWFATLGRPRDPKTEGRGAWYWDGKTFRRPEGLGDRRVYDIAARDPRGTVWFATLNGLVAIEGSKIVEYTPASGTLAASKVWCLRPGRDGSLWIGYQRGQGGASRLARGSVTHFRQADGLCNDEVWSIVEGKPGVFWFATAAGLARYDGRRWSCFRFTKRGLWPVLPLDDGSVWVGSLGDGLWKVDPGDEAPPRTRVELAGDAILWRGTDAWFDTPADRIWYRWRVDSGRWSQASPKTSLPLARLAPGRHTVEVQALDLFGNAEDPPAAIEVVVPGAYRFPYLIVLAGAALAAILLLFRRRGSAARAR